MAAKLTVALADAIADAIRSMPQGEPVTWVHVVDIAGRRGVSLTRQTLCANEVVARAYRDANGREPAADPAHEEPTERRPESRVERLERVNECLLRRLNDYDLLLLELIEMARKGGWDVAALGALQRTIATRSLDAIIHTDADNARARRSKRPPSQVAGRSRVPPFEARLNVLGRAAAPQAAEASRPETTPIRRDRPRADSASA